MGPMVAHAIMHDNHAIVVHYVLVYDHIAATVVINHPVADHNVVAAINVDAASRLDHIGRLVDNDAIARYIVDRWANDFPGDRPHDCRLRGHYRTGSRHSRQGDLVEQRLTMAIAVKVQTHQTAPAAFKDQELLLVIVTPVLTNLIAAIVNDAELVAILQHRGIVVLHFNVQVLLRPCLCRRSQSGMGLIEPRNSLVMPSRTELNARVWIGGPCDSHAAQNYRH